eukprot:2973418-Amphidinium_carterae.1
MDDSRACRSARNSGGATPLGIARAPSSQQAPTALDPSSEDAQMLPEAQQTLSSLSFAFFFFLFNEIALTLTATALCHA